MLRFYSGLFAILLLAVFAGPILAQSSLPVPTPRQLAWQELEFTAFIHFGINTFTNREWGTGREDPAQFNPTEFDARQWARVCKEAGMGMIILTAKHHDGFCLWPTATTDHSVKRSPWRDGRGDVVREVADACREAGLKFGLYLSPWDMNAASYGTDAYNAFYLQQLRELLTNYGDIAEVWFDGAKGADAKEMVYDFDAYWALVRELQPNAVIFSDAGPDVRWVGNERGHAGETNWSTVDRSKITIGGSMFDYLNTGDPDGPHWVPAECNTSIRPGWFYHPEEDQRIKSREQLFDTYFKSVGRNGLFLLNLAPDRRGRIPDGDVQRLREFRRMLDETFRVDFAQGALVSASSTRENARRYTASHVSDGDATTYWMAAEGAGQASLVIELPVPRTFDVLALQEPIRLGQRVAQFSVQAWLDDAWAPLVRGTTIGYKRLLQLPMTTTRRLLVTIEAARATPALATVALYRTPPSLSIEPAYRHFSETVTVELVPSEPGCDIYYTIDGSVPTTSSMKYRAPFIVAGTTTVRAFAVWPSGYHDFLREATFQRYLLRPRQAVNPRPVEAGLAYVLYAGDFDRLPGFAQLSPVVSGRLDSLDLSRLPVPADGVALRLHGYLRIADGGLYSFHLKSADGSRLQIGGQVVVDQAGAGEKRGEIALTAGFHAFELAVFRRQGAPALELQYESSELPKQPVPASLFYRR